MSFLFVVFLEDMVYIGWESCISLIWSLCHYKFLTTLCSGVNGLSPKKWEIKAIIALITVTVFLVTSENNMLGRYNCLISVQKSEEKHPQTNNVFVFFLYKFTPLFLPLNEPIMCRTDNNTRHQGHTPTSWQSLKHLVNPHPT